MLVAPAAKDEKEKEQDAVPAQEEVVDGFTLVSVGKMKDSQTNKSDEEEAAALKLQAANEQKEKERKERELAALEKWKLEQQLQKELAEKEKLSKEKEMKDKQAAAASLKNVEQLIT